MNLGARIIDIEHPSLVGVFNGEHLRGGKPYASIKYPGQPMQYVPMERIKAATQRGPHPVTPAEYNTIEREHGKTPAELARLAKANGVSLRVAADASRRGSCHIALRSRHTPLL